ncbi:MAG: alanine dehydrogenase [Thermoleophilia bacterium]|nr:alanine dehydrogenase [Thermoleophilia bacterium]MDH3724650.1 alanine dehydrogenase [Thermoleophilia bacterium]
MRVGVPRETKSDEHRVAMTPAGVDELVRRGHEVWVENQAGAGAGFDDPAYERVGAMMGDAPACWDCDLVVKVKEPQLEEFALLRGDQILFTYLHLAAYPGVADALLEAGTTSVAYETVEDSKGRLPLLAPMSEVAGRLAVQAGAQALEKPAGGRGVLLGGVAGVSPGRVVVIGGGQVGINAAMIASGMQAQVAVLDVDLGRLRELELVIGGRIELLHSTRLAIEEQISQADVVVGAVLVPGDRAPRVITREMLGVMRPGSVIVDVAVDQGGCVETTKPTTHSNPTYAVDGIVHYCVANMPGAVPVTSTRALSNATLPYVMAIADGAVEGAARHLPALVPGINTQAGEVVNETVAQGIAQARAA